MALTFQEMLLSSTLSALEKFGSAALRDDSFRKEVAKKLDPHKGVIYMAGAPLGFAAGKVLKGLSPGLSKWHLALAGILSGAVGAKLLHHELLNKGERDLVDRFLQESRKAGPSAPIKILT